VVDVIEAIKSRHSVRAFQDRPVDPQIITEILEAARYAPSAVNTQPWHVAVLQDKTLKVLGDKILAARAANIEPNPDYQYYPNEWFEPFKTRRVECGKALYGALNIDRRDTDKRLAQWNKNYRFFGAPVGLMIFINQHLETGSWMDLGMFIDNIMLAARQFDLGTCPQAALAEHPNIVRETLNINEPWTVVCGIALGYPDENHPVNQYRTDRVDVKDFTLWYD
jgi:nitroreductase